jgi:hypothetical protein
MISEWWTGNNLEGSDRGLIKKISQHFSGGTQEKHKKPQDNLSWTCWPLGLLLCYSLRFSWSCSTLVSCSTCVSFTTSSPTVSPSPPLPLLCLLHHLFPYSVSFTTSSPTVSPSPPLPLLCLLHHLFPHCVSFTTSSPTLSPSPPLPPLSPLHLLSYFFSFPPLLQHPPFGIKSRWQHGNNFKKAVPLPPCRIKGGENLQLLIILNLRTRWVWLVSFKLRARFTPEEGPSVPIG